MAATRLVSPLEKGCLVHVKYLDHCMFRNADPRLVKPIVQDAWGILDSEQSEYVTLIVSSYTDPTAKDDALRAAGLVIIRSTILEMGRLD